MRGDDGHNAAGGQDETLAFGLLEGILRFFQDFGLLLVHERIAPDAATDREPGHLERFGQRR
jgi:hypothetical protein